MSINTIAAANAYRNQLKMQEVIADSSSREEAQGSSFSDLLREGVRSFVDSQYNAEEMKLDAMTGKVELTDLVNAVNNAELALNTVVAIRDKVISAYQDIIRMPV